MNLKESSPSVAARPKRMMCPVVTFCENLNRTDAEWKFS